jgi:hypothetical protein
MARKWINSATVEIGDDGSLLVSLGNLGGSIPLATVSRASGFAGGTRTIATSEAANLTGKLVANSTPCRAVWIGARMANDGSAVNTSAVFIGDVGGQTMGLAKDDFKGFLIPIDDASKVYIKAVTSGEGVAYRILT